MTQNERNNMYDDLWFSIEKATLDLFDNDVKETKKFLDLVGQVYKRFPSTKIANHQNINYKFLDVIVTEIKKKKVTNEVKNSFLQLIMILIVGVNVSIEAIG